MSSLPTLALKSPNVLKEFIEHMFQFLVETVSHITDFILCWGMIVQNNYSTPVTTQ
jgi:hypothetical protein